MLKRGQKYLQVALNSNLFEAQKIIAQLPHDRRILLEAGTPLIKSEGINVVRYLKSARGGKGYIVADLKTADLADWEVKMASQAGASAVVCLGVAPIETIDLFITECQKHHLDSMVDMMNVKTPSAVLEKLKVPPTVVILHRGVDEESFNKEKELPYYEIGIIKNNFDILIAVAGGDEFTEVQRAILNDADIVVVWKSFFISEEGTGQLAEQFLKEIR
ncbi:MAG: orotidine 5'-phosphate decarboxylase [Candidatus Pacebacteria bacterium]|nr:orotidine 5'-phosphate decarboxylase [Candidatus Paceibacterota bacterium]